MRNIFRVLLSSGLSSLLVLSGFGAPGMAATATFNCGAGNYDVVSGVATGGEDCTGALTLDSSVTEIGFQAFNSAGITSVVIPRSVVTIGENAFLRTELNSLQFQAPSNLITIGRNSFRDTRNLESVSLPDSLRIIQFGAFFNPAPGPRSLATINLGKGVTTIGVEAFQGATTSSIVIPASVEFIGASAFKDMINLSTITFETGSRLQGLDQGDLDLDIGVGPTFLNLSRLSHVVYCGTPPDIISNYAFPNSVSVSKFGCSVSEKPVQTAITKVSNPIVSGQAKTGKVLTQIAGKWNGSNRLVSYQWYRCDKQVKASVKSKPAKCRAIAGAKAKSYKLTKKDKKKYVLVSVTARNSISSLTSWSKSTKKIN